VFHLFLFTRDGGATLTLPRALLFDMDGTITEPILDFAAIKAEMGIGEAPILEAMASMDAGRRAACEQILSRHEEHAAENSQLNTGCRELLAWVAERRMPTAVITRNSRQSLTTVLARHDLCFDLLITRDDGRPKPEPEMLHLACERLGIAAHAAWMIGDGRYDVEAGLAAGARTVWISHGQKRPFAAEPWRVMRDLIELRNFLAGCG
jgi:HAD superfamily hydrolase (TIGR01509 family)